jgi:hypothetical protein
MFTALDRANLTVHSVDPSGLNAVGPMGRANSTLRGAVVQREFIRDAADNLQHQNALAVLPERTGGRTVVNTNAPNDHVAGIFRESDSYYLLGFLPSETAGDRAPHKISVKVNRRGLVAHARSEYVSQATTNQPLSALLPDASSPLELNVATFAAPDSRRATVMLVAGLEDSGSGKDTLVELTTVALDHAGRSKATARQTVDLSRPAGAPAEERRIDILSRLDLPPGDYEIRAGATSGDGARSASVFTDVTVPAFDTEPLSLSSIFIGALPGTTTLPRDFVASLLPIVPTAQREFRSGGQLTAFVRIYQGTERRDPLLPVRVRTFLVDAKGQTVTGESVVLTEAQFDSGRSHDYFITLPIANLPSGEYLLRIESEMGGRMAGRAVRFRLRG